MCIRDSFFIDSKNLKKVNVISKTQIKLVKSLGQQKFRQKYGKFTAEGEKSVTEFIKNMYFPIEAIYIVDELSLIHI